MTGPLVMWSVTPISCARICASVVLPRPGRPAQAAGDRAARRGGARPRRRRGGCPCASPARCSRRSVFGRSVRSKRTSSPCADASSACAASSGTCLAVFAFAMRRRVVRARRGELGFRAFEGMTALGLAATMDSVRQELMRREATQLAGTAPGLSPRRARVGPRVRAALAVAVRRARARVRARAADGAARDPHGLLARGLRLGRLPLVLRHLVSPETPFIGRSVRAHLPRAPRRPDGDLRHDFVETNGSNMLAGGVGRRRASRRRSAERRRRAPVGFLLFAGALHVDHQPNPQVGARGRALPTSSACSSAHAHPRRRRRTPATTTRRSIARYCITCGWLNGTLHFVRFFRVLEAIVSAVTGATPRADESPAGAQGAT